MSDWGELQVTTDYQKLEIQASRCMDCGVPFCNSTNYGCPLGNRIPEFNKEIKNGNYKQGLKILLATNPFPEFTGRVCPAPCEGGCVLGIIDQPVTIKNMERALIDKGFEMGWIDEFSNKQMKYVNQQLRIQNGMIKVAIIGSGPAGLAAAYELNHFGWFFLYFFFCCVWLVCRCVWMSVGVCVGV